jgi:putative methionine-R-sulfoxide reductase with GAF domain
VRKEHEAPDQSDRIRRDARIAGLRDFKTPSLEAIEHRRAQLWVRTAVGLVVAVIGFAALSTWGGERDFVVHMSQLRTAFLVLAGGFFAFASFQEVSLTRLTRTLTDERVLTAALTNRLHEVELLLDAGKEMNAVLELPILTDTILRSATELLAAGGGSLLLLEGDALVVVGVRGRDEAKGTRVRLGDGVAGHVALRREPILIHGYVDPNEFPGLADREPYVESAMSVPLLYHDHVLGVLNINAAIGRAFTQHDLRALAVFAEQAAGAISNAYRYEAERAQVAELLQHRREGTTG